MVKRRQWEIATRTVTNFARLSKSSTRTRHGAPTAAGLRTHLLGDHCFSAVAEEVRSAAHYDAAANPAAGSIRSPNSDTHGFDFTPPLRRGSALPPPVHDRHRE